MLSGLIYALNAPVMLSYPLHIMEYILASVLHQGVGF